MATITTRAGKEAPLTNAEVDSNFTNLNTDKAETDGATLTNVDINSGTIDGVTIGGASAGAGTFTTITGSGDMNIDSGTLFVDASEDAVGIGTNDPQLATLHITTDSTYTINLQNDASNESGIIFSRNGNGGASSTAIVGNGETTGYINFITGGSDSARLDSSGNLLVGTTELNLYNNSTDEYGTRVSSSGGAVQISANGTCLYANRQNSDGDLIQFREDGLQVGSIGVAAGERLYIGNNDVGLRFAGDLNQIAPWNPSTNGVSNGQIDLGEGVARFKDLYLAGTANVNTLLALGTSSTVGRIRTPNQISIADDSSITLTSSVAGGYLLNVYENGTGSAAVYFVNFAGQPAILSQNGSVTFSTSDVDGNYCVIKSNGSHSVTFKNRFGATRNFHITLIGGNPI